jgi:ATP-dependent DNA helicase RecG
MVSPVYEKVKASLSNPSLTLPYKGREDTIHTARIVPMYPLTQGITQKQLRYLISQIIDLANNIKEWLPNEVLDKADLIPLALAIRGVHFPVDKIDLKQSEKRLKFGELFIRQLHAEIVRQSLKNLTAPALEFKESEIKNFGLYLWINI